LSAIKNKKGGYWNILLFLSSNLKKIFTLLVLLVLPDLLPVLPDLLQELLALLLADLLLADLLLAVCNLQM